MDNHAQPLHIAKQGRIVEIESNQLEGRMVEMGIRNGKLAKVLRTAPFGRSYYVQFGQQVIGMRDTEIRLIKVI